jgi:ATP-dependent helicase/nuclease subunit A
MRAPSRAGRADAFRTCLCAAEGPMARSRRNRSSPSTGRTNRAVELSDEAWERLEKLLSHYNSPDRLSVARAALPRRGHGAATTTIWRACANGRPASTASREAANEPAASSSPPETIERQRLASDPGLSAWVSANAGSGKTHVLSQRVIRLLLAGSDPSRILCLTYTRAAAANMSRRVFDTLAAGRGSTMPRFGEDRDLGGRRRSPTMREARRLFARALETPGGLKIQTIHAFCEAVLHQFPLEANIAGPFRDARPADGGRAARRGAPRDDRRHRASRPAGPGGSIRHRAAAWRRKRAGIAASEIVSRRDALARFIAEIGTGPEGRAAAGRIRPRGRRIGRNRSSHRWPDAFFDQAMGARIAERGHRRQETRVDLPTRLLPVFGAADAEMCSGCAAPSSPARKASGSRARRATSPPRAWRSLPRPGRCLRRLRERVAEAVDRLALWRMLQSTHAALVLADRLIGIYERLKSARGYLDFNDLIVRTVNLLAGAMPAPGCSTSSTRASTISCSTRRRTRAPTNGRSSGRWPPISLPANRHARTRPHGLRGRRRKAVHLFLPGRRSRILRAERPRVSGHASRGAGARFEKVRLLHSFRSVEDVLTAVDLTFEARRCARA